MHVGIRCQENVSVVKGISSKNSEMVVASDFYNSLVG